MNDGNAEIGKSLVASGRIVDLPLPEETSVTTRYLYESREYPFTPAPLVSARKTPLTFRHSRSATPLKSR
jgi:hypothetical protein